MNTTQNYHNILQQLVHWFQSFQPNQLTNTNNNLYHQLTLKKKKIYHHRTYTFIITTHNLNIPTQYITNETHIFIKIYIPNNQN